MTLQSPPDECLVDLMGSEQQRQRRQGQVVTASINVADGVHTDDAEHNAPEEIALRGEAHTK